MSTKLSIAEILRGNMERVNELTNQQPMFTAKDGIIEYTGYSGNKGMLAKSGTAYVVAYLEVAPVKGVEIVKVPVISNKGKAYFKYVFKYNKTVDANKVIALFEDIVTEGRKI